VVHLTTQVSYPSRGFVWSNVPSRLSSGGLVIMGVALEFIDPAKSHWCTGSLENRLHWSGLGL
jgi:hypothetical protein